jgi:hypothetical protein
MRKFAKELLGTIACFLAFSGGCILGLQGIILHPNLTWQIILLGSGAGLAAAIFGAAAFGKAWWIAPLVFCLLAQFSMIGAIVMTVDGGWFWVFVVGPTIGLPFLEGYVARRFLLWWKVKGFEKAAPALHQAAKPLHYLFWLIVHPRPRR